MLAEVILNIYKCVTLVSRLSKLKTPPDYVQRLALYSHAGLRRGEFGVVRNTGRLKESDERSARSQGRMFTADAEVRRHQRRLAQVRTR